MTDKISVPYNAHEDAFGKLLETAGLVDVSKKISPNPWRMLCFTTHFISKIDGVLSDIVASKGQATPEAQLRQELKDFCNGFAYVYPRDYHSIDPILCFAWELKTSDVRVYGWFIEKDLFVAHFAADANKTHGDGCKLVTKFAQEIKEFRKNLVGINNLFVRGVRGVDVLSNRTR